MRDWASDTADLIVRTVDNVRHKTKLDRVDALAKKVVAGMLVAFFALTAVTILTAVVFRALVVIFNELPGPHDNAWMAWAVLGFALVAASRVLWSKRTAPAR